MMNKRQDSNGLSFACLISGQVVFCLVAALVSGREKRLEGLLRGFINLEPTTPKHKEIRVLSTIKLLFLFLSSAPCSNMLLKRKGIRK